MRRESQEPVRACELNETNQQDGVDAKPMPERSTMCLAVPGKILEIIESGGGYPARVDFGGIVRQVHLLFVPEAKVGDFVMVHVGFAISVVDGDEAERTYEVLRALEPPGSESPTPAETP